MLHYGVVTHNHDASIAVVQDKDILFASQSERFSQIKNDPELKTGLPAHVLKHYPNPDCVHYFETPYNRNHLRNGRIDQVRTKRQVVSYLRKHLNLSRRTDIVFHDHHLSHAATACETSTFEDAVVVVLDAVGQNDCLSIYQYDTTARDRYKLLHRTHYPDSMGLFYTAMTQRVGLKPNQDEYILMAMADLGKPIYTNLLKDTFFKDFSIDLKLKHNVHRGIGWFGKEKVFSFSEACDLAASTQALFTEYVLEVVAYARLIGSSNNLALGGGCFLNGVTNNEISRLGLFERIWINPNPGDGGSSLGAIALGAGTKLNYQDSFLGFDTNHTPNVEEAIKQLIAGKAVAVCTGKAEFGPRALGNRSILFDASIPEAQSIMNALKRRQGFRPFAPVVLAEDAHEVYDLHPSSDYRFMQYVVPVKTINYPGATHVNQTARVQTVSNPDHFLYALLVEWKRKTGKQVLVNTSFNVKDMPIINYTHDAYIAAGKMGILLA